MNCLVHGIKKGELYPEAVRQFCLSIHFQSPAAYKVVRNAFKKKLPHPNTIASWYRYSNIKGNPGFHKETCERLKKIASNVFDDTKIPLVCSLIVDEMYIRKQVLWCNQVQQYMGYISYGAKEDQKLLPIANQAIVFLLNGINQRFEFPFGYHFIQALNAEDKANLYLEVIQKVTECGIIIKNITFDGLASNFAMCNRLGANLDVFSNAFKPFILNPVNQSKIFIMFDNCHAEKLVRNTLGNRGVIFDESGELIEWKHLEDLVQFSNRNDLRTHKLSRKHIEFKSSVMNVKIATETLSNSVADSLQYLLDKGVPKFKKVKPTIRFIQIFNNLFDIFNSRDTNSVQIFKNHYVRRTKRQFIDLWMKLQPIYKILKLERSRMEKVRKYQLQNREMVFLFVAT